MNVLILSKYLWDDETAFGNTFNDIFNGLPNVNIINIACGTGKPNTKTKITCFKIDECLMVKSILFRKLSTGYPIEVSQRTTEKASTTNQGRDLMSWVKNHKLQFFYWAQEMIWLLGKWKSKELIEFVRKNDIDVIFQPLYSSFYMNRIARWIKSETKKPMLLYSSDDAYSLKQFNFSPFFWIDRLLKRCTIKKTAKQCDEIYVISSLLKKEYDRAFGCDCKLLTKSNSFNNKNEIAQINNPLKIVYTGNISLGRWNSLVLIGEALDKINTDSVKAELLIYTATPLNKKMKKKILQCKSIKFMGSVPFFEIDRIQNEADILVHAESFALKYNLQVRMSFSTKIVDYLTRKKCVLAIGPSNVASVEYFKTNDAAVVIDNPNDCIEILQKLITNPSKLAIYAQKAWDCGVRNHLKKDIDNMLMTDFERLVGKNA